MKRNLAGVLIGIGQPTKAFALCELLWPTTTRLWEETTLGPRAAPASLPRCGAPHPYSWVGKRTSRRVVQTL